MTTPDCRACRGEWPDAAAMIADCGPAVAYLNEDQFFPGWTVRRARIDAIRAVLGR